MSSYIRVSSITFGLRLVTILSKFGLFIFLGRYVDSSEIGVYAIIVSTVMFAAQFMGLEFHYYNTREIQKKDVGENGPQIRDQFAMHLVSYLIFFPLLLLVFYFDFIDYKYVYQFYILVTLEHISQELFRILAAKQMPISATLNIFLRTASWVFFLIPILYIGHSSSVVSVILNCWIIASLSSALVSIYQLRGEFSYLLMKSKIDWAWVRTGLIQMRPYMVSAISFSALVAIDKFVLKYYSGDAAVGIYFFMYSLAAAYYTLLTFSVGVIYGPKMLHAFHNETTEKFLDVRRDGIKKTFIAGGLLLLPAMLGIYVVLPVINTVYGQYVNLYMLLLFANVVWAFSDVLNYDLYIRGHDITIMLISLAGIVVSVIAQLVLVPLYSVYGAAIATSVAFMFLSVFRYYALKKKVNGYALLM